MSSVHRPGRLRARFRSVAAYFREHRAEMVALTEILTDLRGPDRRLRYADTCPDHDIQAHAEQLADLFERAISR